MSLDYIFFFIENLKLSDIIGNICAIVVYSVSLRQQLQDVGKKLVGAQHYNKDGSVNNRQNYYSAPDLHILTIFLYHACLYFQALSYLSDDFVVKTARMHT